MKTFRRVVTGVGADGKAHFVSDGPAAIRSGTADTGVTFMWAIDSPPTVPTDGKDQATTDRSFHPKVGGSRCLMGIFQPGFGVVMPESGLGASSERPNRAAASFGELGARSASAPAMSLDRLSMHATPTVDYATVLSGEVDLILDSGEVVTLGPTDTVIQNGTMHGWRNASDKPVVIAFTMIGATDPTSAAS